MGRFDGLTVLLTGATGGFGRRLAERLAVDRVNLVLSDIRQADLDTLAASLDTECATLAGDVSQESLSQALVKLAIDRFGRVDIAINNAGIAQSFVNLPQVPSD
jgi:NADP-dependent 3-hydroxy acid dehydrogenase YdfG